MDILFCVLWGTLLPLLFVASVIDMKKGIIPNWLILLGLGTGILEHLMFQGVRGLIIAVFGGAVWLIVGLLLWRTTKLGAGDGKLLSMIGVYTGFAGVPLVFAMAVMGQFVVYLIRFSRGKMAIRLPFAPAFALGSVGLLFWQLTSMKGGF